jgi:uncharacterized repeat protein (TIGR03803 family)
VLATHVPAQTFNVLRSFSPTAHDLDTNSSTYGRWTNSDGAFITSLIASGNTLYGTTQGGGSAGAGTIFKLGIDGTGFSTLYNFSPAGIDSDPGSATYGSFTNSDGRQPTGLLVLANNLYGTTWAGGPEGNGTVFTLSTDGSGFTTLYSFTPAPCCPVSNVDGAYPNGLLLAGNTLYGTCDEGGPLGGGTVFSLNTDGTGFTLLMDFMATSSTGCPTTNVGGFSPRGLVSANGVLYGTTDGGITGSGTVFGLNTDGTGFSTLHGFAAWNCNSLTPNLDGVGPGGLVLGGNTLFGTAKFGGTGGSGTIFALSTDGTKFTTVYNFARLNANSPATNSDGAWPIGFPFLSGDTLYGVTRAGGSSPWGTVFAVNTNGTGFKSLGIFTGGDVGPRASLLVSGNALYGMTAYNGAAGNGMIFSITFSPQLAITPTGTNIALTWPANFAGFDYGGYTLESATNLGPGTVWSTNLPAPTVVNGQYTVTNPISGAQQFFRLSQ